MALTTTLVIVAFATALKDIIEVARDIRDAFERLPQNYERIRNLTSEIVKTVQKMNVLYTEKKDTLESSPELQESLSDLRQEMINVYRRCSRLIPPISERKRDKFKIAFYSFWRREEIQKLILELKNHIDNCYKQFMLLSAIRIEATVNQIARALNAEAGVHAHDERYIHSGPSSAQLFQFTQPQSTPLGWTNGTIPLHDLSRAYLRTELGSIEKSLSHLAYNLSPGTLASFEAPPLKMCWALQKTSASCPIFQRTTIIQVFQLQSLLLNFEISVLSKISVWISVLSADLGEPGMEMNEEALSVRKWCVNLWKHLAFIRPSKNALYHLADHLTNLSVCYCNVGDRDGAYNASREAMDVLHRILDTHRSTSQSPEIRELMARNLTSQSQSLPPSTLIDAIELENRAVGAMEQALAFQGFHVDDGPPLSTDTTDPHSQTLTPKNMVGVPPENVAPNMDSLFTYSTILDNLSILQEGRKQILNAHATKKRALEILRFLVIKYPQSKRVLPTTASTLATLYGHTYCGLNSTAQNLEYSNECVDIYRKLFEKTKNSYWLLPLSSALWALRQFLVAAGRPNDAEAVYKEMTDLTQVASQTFSDLKLPSEIEGDYHFHLAVSHRSAGRIPDAIYAAHNSVAQYSALVFMDPHRSAFKHVKALSLLCALYCSSQQYHLALSEGYKAFSIIDDAVTRERTMAFKVYKN